MTAKPCWCEAYHFTDLAGREICEHYCHGGELDADDADRELGAAMTAAERCQLEDALAFRQQLVVNPAGYLRGLDDIFGQITLMMLVVFVLWWLQVGKEGFGNAAGKNSGQVGPSRFAEAFHALSGGFTGHGSGGNSPQTGG